MKCPNCGAENPEGRTFCGDCGLPFDAVEGLSAKWQKCLAGRTAILIALISVLLIVIGLGFLRASNDLDYYGSDIGHVAHSFYDLAWLFGLLGIAGFFIAGLAYLLALPLPKTERGVSPASERTIGKERRLGSGGTISKLVKWALIVVIVMIVVFVVTFQVMHF